MFFSISRKNKRCICEKNLCLFRDMLRQRSNGKSEKKPCAGDPPAQPGSPFAVEGQGGQAGGPVALSPFAGVAGVEGAFHAPPASAFKGLGSEAVTMEGLGSEATLAWDASEWEGWES